MIVPFFDLKSQLVEYKPAIMGAIENVIDSGTYIGGPEIEKFENEFSTLVDSKHVIGVANGLDAIRIILESLNIGPGDEVIVPGFSFYATWLAVMQVGATPIFVDVRKSDAALDERLIRDKISSRTRALIVVHLYGIPADLSKIKKIADEHGIFLVEDAAQAHGAKRDSIIVGSAGAAAAFSFYPTKNLGALGDAGAISTNLDEINKLSRSFRSYGQGESKYEHVNLGWNSRLDPIQASVLSVHIEKLAQFTSRRREIAERYLKILGEYQSYVVGPNTIADSVWHHFVLRVKNRPEVITKLKNSGVGSDIHYPYFAGNVQPVSDYLLKAGGAIVGELPNAKILSESVLSLPIGPWMSDSQIKHVEQSLNALKHEIF